MRLYIIIAAFLLSTVIASPIASINRIRLESEAVVGNLSQTVQEFLPDVDIDIYPFKPTRPH
ncbi:hypothetical protein BT96DRAFT_1027386 [Gymnopus androsaceus JB14]|uniref:Uncharacterized protein n=1 Tax=Gymnopus androsaceus JB14 TaxID=1447944 RepID=A0A6A4GCE7_9AGAR|nr:hypothetical protein BT96DRAFT_1027386 [Gymnopus androsaceus JB14]